MSPLPECDCLDCAPLHRLAAERDAARADAARQRDLALRLAERVLAAHEVLARRAERRGA